MHRDWRWVQSPCLSVRKRHLLPAAVAEHARPSTKMRHHPLSLLVTEAIAIRARLASPCVQKIMYAVFASLLLSCLGCLVVSHLVWSCLVLSGLSGLSDSVLPCTVWHGM